MALIHADQHLTICEITKLTTVLFGSVQPMLTGDLQMRRITDRIILCILTDEQKEHHVSSSTSLTDQYESAPMFISKAITRGETWVYGYDPETKRQSSQWKTAMSLRPKNSHQSRIANGDHTVHIS